MAETTPVAERATLPSTDDIERAAAFTREPFLTEGEDPASSLSPGTPRRRALDAALAELETGATFPSIAWRRQWSLLLGLERLLSQDEPTLVDGTVLSAHQVDALSGTLTALLADALRNGNGNGGAAEDEVVLASAGIPGEEDYEDEDEPEEPHDWDDRGVADDEEISEAPEDPNAGKRFWFEHATGAGKTVAALGFVEASRTGGVLILTHRRNLVDQFHGELRDRGYAKRISPALLGSQDSSNGPVTVETYQWFVRNAGKVSDAYTIVICDEAHTALGEKTSGAIRAWAGPIFIGMTATGALIARHVTDLFPTQTSRFDLAQAARRGVISPLRCVRIPPGPGVRTIAKVPLRRGEVDTEFDQEMLAQLLDQLPFNLAVADLYQTRFNGVPGVVYAAGVRHAYNVAQAFRDLGMKAQAVSGETPKRELAQILARYERGDVDVLVNAQLLAEGWNSPRATVCMHLAPTASKRIYQQRVGRVTRRHPGKEAGIVVDFVHPATKHDDPVVTLHSLLDRDVYRGGAIVVGPVRRGRGRRLRVERRVLPVTADENRRIEVFERELWRIAVEHLDYGEQVQWAALAGARVAPTGWRRARAMLHFDQGGELKRTFLLTAVDRNKNPQLRLRALQEVASGRDPEAFDRALDFVESWPRDDKREAVKVVLQALAEKKIGRRDQANNWIWRCANMTREVHEEYAVQRWPETKRLLGLLVNSSGGAHARNARRLVHAARQQDRRLSAALLAAAIPHTAEAGEVINGARTRMSRKPAALARELLRNFPKGRGKTKRRRRRKGAGEAVAPEALAAAATTAEALDATSEETTEVEETETPAPRRRSRRKVVDADRDTATPSAEDDEQPRPRSRKKATEAAPRRRSRRKAAEPAVADAVTTTDETPPRRRSRTKPAEPVTAEAVTSTDETTPRRRSRTKPAEPVADAAGESTPRGRSRKRTTEPVAAADVAGADETTTRGRARRKPAEPVAAAEAATAGEATPRGRSRRKPAEPVAAAEAATAGEATPRGRSRRKPAEPVAAAEAATAGEATPRGRSRRKPTEPATEVAAAAEAKAAEPVAAPDVAAADKATPRRRSRKTAAESVVAAEAAPARSEGGEVPEAQAVPRRRGRAKAGDVVVADGEAAPRRRSRRKPADPAEPLAAPVSAPLAADEVAPPARRKAAAARKPAAKPRARKKAAEAPAEDGAEKSPLEAASERVRAAVEDAAA